MKDSTEHAAGGEQPEYEAVREEELRILRLSDEERDLFLHVLEHPPEPNEALERAIKRPSVLINQEESNS